MVKSISSKTEKRALNVLESIIDAHETIDYQFNYADKEMSWDGFILLPKNDTKGLSKANFAGRIPVQIKGHEDYNDKYINKKTITYEVELNDLNAYSTEKGIMYFQIFIDDKKGEVFYASLYPSRIADIMERAERKGNKESKRIPFIRMPKDAIKMANILRQFIEESKIQGTAFTPLVVNRIRTDEFEKIQELNFTVVGARNAIDALMRIPSGDICLYGKMEGDKYLRPIESLEMPVVRIEREVQEKISVGDEVFFERFHLTIDSNEGAVIVPSPNLKLNITKGEICLQLNSCVEQLHKDARFMLALREKTIFQHGNIASKLSDIKPNEDFDNKVSYILNLYETMEMIGLDITVPYSSYTSEQKDQLKYLVNLKCGAYNHRLTNQYMKYTWKFGDKYVPLLIEKHKNMIELHNTIYNNKLIICLPNETDNSRMGERMPLFAYHSVSVLSNLYYYDYDMLREQISCCDVTSNSIGTLFQCVLLMINVYDTNSDTNFLDLSDYLLDLMDEYEHSDLIILNKLQIKKRRGIIDPSDIDLLNSISNDNVQIQFGKNVLLGNKALALQYFDQLSDDEKAEYRTYPIYTLLNQI